MIGRRTSRGDAPLRAWGDALRAAARRRRHLRRAGVALAVGIAALGMTIIVPPSPRLVWNASASAPVGLYAVAPGKFVSPGAMVLARLAEPWRSLAARRRYLPSNVPLVKRVAAGPGDSVCGRGAAILINGNLVAWRRAFDGQGRPMPRWQGCHMLGSDQYFLLMAASPASFDGRYFGISRRADIIGPATLLWAR